jgi:RNA polymerase sigma factor (sigma-70 family)
MQDTSDVELLREIGAGDEAALRELFDRHAPWLRMRLRRRSAVEELVSDALQDTFVAVWKSAGSYRGDGEIGAWLWGIAVRRLISRLRVRESPVPASAEAISSWIPSVRSAEDELLVGVEHGDVGAALRSLSPELRSVVQAMVIDGLTAREVAGLLGLPLGTVKGRMRAAKTQLRTQLVPIQDWRV